MSKLRMPALELLVADMERNNAKKDNFPLQYAKYNFDVVVSIISGGYQLLVGVLILNLAIIVNVNKNFVAELTDDAYRTLRDTLRLFPNKDHFTSDVFLKVLSSNIPEKYSGRNCSHTDMTFFANALRVEDSDKIYFKGWNDHVKDGRRAQNFDKTELFFGKEVANYCRQNNISSMWTDKPGEENKYQDPWDFK